MNISNSLKFLLLFIALTLLLPQAFSTENKSEIIFKVKKENALLFGKQKMPESIFNVLKQKPTNHK